MEKSKKGSILVLLAALAALIGLVIYVVSSYTGYLATSTADMRPIFFSVIALALLVILYVMGGRLPGVCYTATLWAAAALVIASFACFALFRVSLAADVYFIPVNYPEAEEIALKISIGGIVGYAASILMLILEGFFGKEQ